mmetsp:Transcript_1782/g.2564  ORF Transcript_1782/g.2564 Transcript_1782/m.2564 type:complete len:192 (-) Transcript_1782:694-1269(-)
MNAIKPIEKISNIEVKPFQVDFFSQTNSVCIDLSPEQISNSGSIGIVGTVTLMNKSAMVWVGWGHLNNQKEEITQNTDEQCGCGTPNMGAMCVAMPFTEYQGFKTNGESPTSQLVGGECEEDMILGLQMANRLSQKVGWPVYVSCSLGSNIGHIESFGHDATNSSLAQYATALSEKTVMKILMEKKMQIEN